jgi:hypothetical protein
MRILDYTRMFASLLMWLTFSSCTPASHRQPVVGTWRAEEQTLIGPETWDLHLEEEERFKMVSSDPIVRTWIAVGSWTRSGSQVILHVERWGASESQLTNSASKNQGHFELTIGDGESVLRDAYGRRFRKH